MSIELTGVRAVVLHSVAAADARLKGLRAVVLHSVPAVDAQLKGLRAVVLHSVPAANANLVGARMVVLHTVPPPVESGPGLQGSGLLDRPLQGLGFASPNRFIED